MHRAFEEWCHCVEIFFTEEQLKDMGWDILMADNSLCKISRLTELIDTLNPELTCGGS